MFGVKNIQTQNWSKRKLFLYSFISTLLFLILTELICRAIIWVKFSPYHSSHSIQANSRWIDDSTQIWSNRSFYIESHQHFQYNEAGMRVKIGDVFIPPKGKNEFRILLLGGSAMAGEGASRTGDYIKITRAFGLPIKDCIDGQLQHILQEALPGKTVKVFNAAVSGHSIYQSLQRYKQLKKYDVDWVISMDGQNEPPYLKDKQSLLEYLKNEWKNNACNIPPASTSIKKMQYSALYYLLGKYFYNLNERKVENNIMDSTSFYKFHWLMASAKPINYIENATFIEASTDTFLYYLKSFDSILNVDRQKHLLLVQPHLSLRSSKKLSSAEEAVYNYYTSLKKDTVNTFMKVLHNKCMAYENRCYSLICMDDVNRWDMEVFVDYCHFTKKANRKIADEIARYILARGDYVPFQVRGR